MAAINSHTLFLYDYKLNLILSDLNNYGLCNSSCSQVEKSWKGAFANSKTWLNSRGREHIIPLRVLWQKGDQIPPTGHRFYAWVGKITLEKGMATHSSVLAWIISRTEKPGGLQSKGSKRVRRDWVTFTFHKIVSSMDYGIEYKYICKSLWLQGI